MTTTKQKKGDTSNEVKRGTFLTRLDNLKYLCLTMNPPKRSMKQVYALPSSAISNVPGLRPRCPVLPFDSKPARKHIA